MGKIIKFIIVKLKGSNENVVKDPIIKGQIYSVKKRLLKYLSNINKIKIFFFNSVHF